MPIGHTAHEDAHTHSIFDIPTLPSAPPMLAISFCIISSSSGDIGPGGGMPNGAPPAAAPAGPAPPMPGNGNGNGTPPAGP